MTVRDVIANAIDHPEFDRRHPIAASERILADLLSAPESVRMELAALLNPWRQIETAPKDGTHILVLSAKGAHVSLWEEWLPPDGAGGFWGIQIGDGDNACDPTWDHNVVSLKPTHWLPLPAPPSEDK